MQMNILLWIVTITTILPPAAVVAPTTDNTAMEGVMTCADMDLGGGGTASRSQHHICAIVSTQVPHAAIQPNEELAAQEETEFIGGYHYTYTILPMDDNNQQNNNNSTKTTIIKIGRTDGDEKLCTGVTINNQPCQRCVYCENDLFSADCTNIPNGRNVYCESIVPIFYPLSSSTSAVASIGRQGYSKTYYVIQMMMVIGWII